MNARITVVTLGPGDPEQMTLQGAETLRKTPQVVLRTSRHPVAAWLDGQGVAYTTLDALYDRCGDFDDLAAALAAELWRRAESAPLAYGVMDATNDASVAALEKSRPDGAALVRQPGVTLADACLAAVPAQDSAAAGLRILPAIRCADAQPDPRLPLLVTEIDNPALAGDVKLWLADLYGDESAVLFFPPRTGNSEPAPQVMPLCELDRQKKYDHTVCAFIAVSPLLARDRFCFADLVEVMDILRGENGCPWDRQQTHESLRKYLIEEAYEAVGAIDEGDMDHLADELGDVLLQVVFHANVAAAHGTFTLRDVTTDICRKMIGRHTHVFGDAHLKTAGEVLVNWAQIKKKEKGLTTQASVLADVSPSLPALMRAEKVQKRASQVGFDWDTPLAALPKVHEEAEEVRVELEKNADPAEELGDLFFSCVNVARLCDLEPEFLLKSATEKFISRFTQMEKLIISDGKSLEGLTLSEMDVYWNQVKSAQNSCGSI